MTDSRSQPMSIEAVADYVSKRTQQPLRGLDDTVHAIHTGTEYAAELRFSDLVEAVNNYESLKARVAELEEKLEPFACIAIHVQNNHPGWANDRFSSEWAGRYRITYKTFAQAAVALNPEKPR